MKPRNLILSGLLALLLIIVFAVGGLLWFNLSRMLPDHNGLAYEDGLNDTVEIIRDELGIPHIYASNVDDLFYAQGYVHAQDRWWQMEFQRHTGMGRIEELTGYNQSALASDLFIRTWGWNRAAAADETVMHDETRTVLEAYSAGVNAYIQGKHGGDLALEYTLLGVTGVDIEIEPWQPIDSASWAKVMAWDLSGNAGSEAWRMELLEQVEQQMVDDFLPAYPFDQHPTILTTDDLPISDESLTTSIPMAALPRNVDYSTLNVATTLAGGGSAYNLLPTQDTGIGSNNWVISGTNTASGTPILANDPHLGIQMPSIWYEVGLHCRPVSEACPYDVVGFSFAGVPAVVIGHNQRIAWGVTNVGPDVQDLYIIRVNPDDPYQYEYNGEWRDMEVKSEVIHFGSDYQTGTDDPATDQCEGIAGLPINDDGELEIEVRLTHFGPIITDNAINDDCEFVAFTSGEDPLALRWTALEPGDLLHAIIRLNQATNWTEFRETLTDWVWPSQNVVYADVDGNIGYQMPGNIPIRAGDHSGLVPVPGWTDEYEWRGYIPFDLLPRIFNPERGWIVTANHAVVPPEYYDQLAEALNDEYGDDTNYTLGLEWAQGFRGQRLVDMISATQAHTLDTVAEIQGDNHNLLAEYILPYLLNVEFEDSALADTATWLAGWDLQNYMDSPQAALFEAYWVALSHNIWDDELEGTNGNAWAVRLLMDQPEDAWWDDINTSTVETRDEILTRSLQAALSYMNDQWGSDRDDWSWGDLHTATFVSTPLGQSGIGLVENLVNAGPVRTSGGRGIVNATGWSLSDPFEVSSVPSMRMIVDLGDLDNSRSIHTTGQSNHRFSPHYRDMIELWRQIEYHPMRFGSEAVEAGAANRLELRPGAGSQPSSDD